MTQHQEPVTLRPMTGEEFDGWRETSVAGYAQEKVTAGEWSPDQALSLARRTFEELLPDGPATADMHLLVAEAAGPPTRTVGRLWIGPRSAGRTDHAWIWDIEVEASERGRGFGRAVLALAERVAREAGFGTIGLNVFGTNAVARGLYDSSGYQVDAQQMSKAL